MKTTARASVFAFILAWCNLGVFACWPTAPPGGDVLDAAAPPFPGSDAGGGFSDGPSAMDGTVGNMEGAAPEGGSASDGGSDADAADVAVAPPGPPFPSQTLATGLAFGCHITASGAVWCWGANQFAQNGLMPPPVGPTNDGGPQPVLLSGDAGPLYATALALGDDYACAIAADAGGAVYCWGRNDNQQLGHMSQGQDSLCAVPGGATGACNPAAIAVTVVSGAAFLAAAGGQTCAASASGTLQCWGSLPTGADASASGISASGIVQLSLASDHSCALSDAGASGNVMACWGNNPELQTSPDLSCGGDYCAAPVTVSAIATPAAVAVGRAFTCAIPPDGGVVCFGDNTRGELGHAPGGAQDVPQDDGGVYVSQVPTQVTGLAGQVAALVATGNDQAACALAPSGTVTCWGNVGAGAGGGLPPLSGLGTPDGLYVCGESADGGVWCWSLDGGAPTQVQ